MLVRYKLLRVNVNKALVKRASLPICSLACVLSLAVFNASAVDDAKLLVIQQQQSIESEFTDELDDDFDDIDAQLEASFMQTDAELEARYQAVHEAIQTAFRKQSSKIEVKWPNDVVVPTGAVWVAYNDNYDERVIYDFEQGFFQLEVTDSDNMQENLERLAQLAAKVSKDKAQTLQSLDVFGQAIAQEVALIEPTTLDNNYQEMPVSTPDSASKPDKAEVQEAVNSADKPNTSIRQALLKPANYQIMASVSAQVPHIDVQDLLLELERKNALKTKQTLVDAENKIASLSPPNSESSGDFTSTPDKSLSVDINDLEPAPIELNLAGTNSSVSSATNTPLRIQKTNNGWALKVPFVNSYQKTLINQRMQTINAMSERFNVDVSLILAIIEAESSFNPMATSHIPAFGLMQLVPKTAGVDAYRHVYGQHRILGPEYLYDVENNIELGTAYIDVLQNRYLRGIENPENKLYSMIASYNTGVGNLANTVSGKKRIRGAIPLINTMEPQAYYDFLQANLPAIETKRYLDKVMTKKQKYLYLDGN